jgi:drug/metabolite transporter (DMT)-like permease
MDWRQIMGACLAVVGIFLMSWPKWRLLDLVITTVGDEVEDTPQQCPPRHLSGLFFVAPRSIPSSKSLIRITIPSINAHTP